MAQMPIGIKPKCSFICASYDRKKIATIPDLGRGEKDDNFHEVKKCLQQYNYLGESSPDSQNTLDESTASALETFQQRYNIPQSGVLGHETKEAMAKPRCAMPDLQPGALAFSISGAWRHRNLTYALGKLSQSIAPSVCEAAIERALTTWSNAGVGLTFNKVADTEDHDIFIEWRRADDPDLNMAGSTLAHADFPPGFSLILDGPPVPLHFDDEEHTWSDGAFEDEFDIETTCLHEIGHCLGLYHSKVPESIMFPTVSSNMTSRTLADDDVKGIRRLYKTRPNVPSRSEPN